MTKTEETKIRFFNLVKFIVIAERRGETKLDQLHERRMELDTYLRNEGLTKTEVFNIEMEAVEQGFKTPLCIA